MPLRTAIAAFVLFISAVPMGIGGPLIVGQSVLYSFANLPLVGPTPFGEQVNVSVNAPNSLPGLRAVLRLELFENSLSDPVFFQYDYDGIDDPRDTFGVAVVQACLPGQCPWPLPGAPWRDNQGVIRLTLLSGAADLNYIKVRVMLGPIEYSETRDFAVVPLPPAGALLLGGSLALMFAGMRRRLRLPGPA